MRRFFTNTLLASAGAAMLFLAGCEVTYDDVADARNNVAEEQRETNQVRQNYNDDIAAAKQDVEEARHNAMRPNYDEDSMEEVREQQRDVEELQREKAEAVREEQEETIEAKREADRMERRLQAQNARDAFVAEMNTFLERVDKKINSMQERLETLEGEAYENLEVEIDNLQEKREALADAIDEVEDADVFEWEKEAEQVKSARDAINLD